MTKNMLIAVAVLFGVARPLLAAPCTIERLDSAVARWARSQSGHYVYSVYRMRSFTYTYLGVPVPTKVQVEIRENRVRAVKYANTYSTQYREGSSVPKSVWMQLLLHPDAIFADVRESILWAARDPDHTIQCDFDETNGLLRRLKTDSTSISDSYYVLEIADFHRKS
jgi:hypothetical protein